MMVGHNCSHDQEDRSEPVQRGTKYKKVWVPKKLQQATAKTTGEATSVPEAQPQPEITAGNNDQPTWVAVARRSMARPVTQHCVPTPVSVANPYNFLSQDEPVLHDLGFIESGGGCLPLGGL